MFINNNFILMNINQDIYNDKWLNMGYKCTSTKDHHGGKELIKNQDIFKDATTYH